MKNFLTFAIISFSLFATGYAMEKPDLSLLHAVCSAKMEVVQEIVGNTELCKQLTGSGVRCALSTLIFGGLTDHILTSEMALSMLTAQERLGLIKYILSIPGIPNLMNGPQVCAVFEVAINFGSASIVQAMLDTQWIHDNIGKKAVDDALISVISDASLDINCINKDARKILILMLGYQRVLDFIDFQKAEIILQNTMIHPNAEVIKNLFANEILLKKAGDKVVKECVRLLGMIKDPSIVAELLDDENFTRHLSQEDWNDCYSCSSSEVGTLLKPHTSWGWGCTLF